MEEDLPPSITQRLEEADEPAEEPQQSPEPPQQSPEPSQQLDEPLSTTHRHSAVRKRATKNYLNNAQKRIKIHNENMKDLLSKYSSGDYVGIRIDKVDRTNTDPKLLPAVIIEKKNDKIKVACEYGIISQWWSLESLYHYRQYLKV